MINMHIKLNLVAVRQEKQIEFDEMNPNELNLDQMCSFP